MHDGLELLYLPSEAVEGVLDQVDVLSAVRSGLVELAHGNAHLPPEAYLRWDNADGWARSLALPAVLGKPVISAGMKIINASPQNPDRGIARAAGVLALFDPTSARIRTVMSAALVSATRTAAVSTLGALALAPRPPDVLAVLGSGPLGAAHARMLLNSSPDVPATVRFHDLVPERAEAAAAELARLFPEARITSVPDYRDAVAGASVIVAATTTEVPYLRLADVEQGCLVINVGLDDCTDELLIGCDVLVVDDWSLVLDDGYRALGRLVRAGRITHPKENVRSAGPAQVAQLGDLVAGRAEVTVRPDSLVVLNPFGMAVADIALAAEIERKAIELGIGMHLPA